MIAIGPSNFGEFLGGAYAADEHFLNASLSKNIPVIMALIGIWHRNVFGFSTQAVIPYDNRMLHFPTWLQQLDMESNGKSVLQTNEQATLDTEPVLFGETGINSQHAFYQFLHQGKSICPCDFLIAVNDFGEKENRHMLLSNCLAQSEALMVGRTLKEAGNNPHSVFEGNRSSNTFLFKNLTSRTLGSGPIN